MPGLNWGDLETVDFKPFDLSWQVEDAIKIIRKAPKYLMDDEIISDDFFEETGGTMSEAVWSEVKNVILRCCGPAVPSHVPSPKGNPQALNIESLGITLAGLKLLKGDAELKTMLQVLARCVFERIGVIRSTLTAPEDWWIRLILNDLNGCVALGSLPDLPA